MTHEDATAYAKARAYDGFEACVMRKPQEEHPRRVVGYSMRRTVSQEGGGWADRRVEVVTEQERDRMVAEGWEVEVGAEWVESYTYTHVVSETSRQAYEAAGWEVLETYEPRRDTGGGYAEVIRPHPILGRTDFGGGVHPEYGKRFS